MKIESVNYRTYGRRAAGLPRASCIWLLLAVISTEEEGFCPTNAAEKSPRLRFRYIPTFFFNCHEAEKRCFGNARTCFYCSQLFWRAAQHDRGDRGGGEVRAAPSGRACHLD